MAAFLTFAVLWIMVGFLVAMFLTWAFQEDLDDMFIWAVIFWPIFLAIAAVVGFQKGMLPKINSFLLRKKK